MIPSQYYHEHLNFFRSKHKLEDYYTTAQIIKLYGVSERTVRSRLAELKVKYKGKSRYLYKDNNQWFISKFIVDEFNSKYKPRKTTRYNQKWQSFITWVMRDSYDDEAHNHLIEKVKEAFPDQDTNKDWCFVIEKTRRGVNHVHGLSLLHHEKLFPVIYQIIKENGIEDTEYDVLVGEVENRHCAEKYLRK